MRQRDHHRLDHRHPHLRIQIQKLEVSSSSSLRSGTVGAVRAEGDFAWMNDVLLPVTSNGYRSFCSMSHLDDQFPYDHGQIDCQNYRVYLTRTAWLHAELVALVHLRHPLRLHSLS